MTAPYVVPTASRYRWLLRAELAAGAGAAALLFATGGDPSRLCVESHDAAATSCAAIRAVARLGLAAMLLVALPLGLAGTIGEHRRSGRALVADDDGIRLGVGGRWQGPLAWNRISTMRTDGGWLGPRIGLDLVEPERVVRDFGRPLGPIEDWRMKRGGPTITIPGYRLAQPVDEVHARLRRLWEANR